MTQKKTFSAKMTLTVEGIDEFSNALDHVKLCFDAFKTAANELQGAVNYLNSIELKINSEQL